MKRSRILSSLSMLAAMCLPVTLFAVLGAPAANAEPLPEEQRMTMIAITLPRIGSSEPGGALVGVRPPSGVAPIAGTTYNVSMLSCGRLVASETVPHTLVEGGGVTFSLSLPRLSDTVGPSIDYQVEVAHPGIDPYVLASTQSMTERGLRTPSCEAVDAPDVDFDDPIVVTKASKAKTGAPKVGRKASITPTRFADVGDPHAEYVWYVGKKNLKTMYAAGGGRSVKVKAQWKGQPLFAVVHLSDSSVRTEDTKQVIKFGRVRG